MEKSKSWVLLILITLAAFVIALNSTFMNVAISQLVIDLDTNVYTVQAIISFYTLITASLMLIGAKLQDILGKKKIFVLGAIFFAIGALIASLSVNIPILFFGWAILEGVGAALMTPGTVAIISESYDGSKRTIGLSIVSAIVGIAATIGPLFGGFFTSFFSWRYGFIFELIIMIIILVLNGKIPSFKPTELKTDFDYKGSILSIIGLILLVLGY
ncbi:MAG: MFS transporter [archaeon]|nr:MFS transporter [archaeon]